MDIKCISINLLGNKSKNELKMSNFLVKFQVENNIKTEQKTFVEY